VDASAAYATGIGNGSAEAFEAAFNECGCRADRFDSGDMGSRG
jgi:hypothetical protein